MSGCIVTLQEVIEGLRQGAAEDPSWAEEAASILDGYAKVLVPATGRLSAAPSPEQIAEAIAADLRMDDADSIQNAALSVHKLIQPLAAVQQLDAELYTAIVGPMPECSRLGWLSGLITDLKQRCEDDPEFLRTWEGDDPSAAWECLREVEAMLAAAKATIKKRDPFVQ